MDLYKTLHPIMTKYTFFSSTHRTFSRQGHMLGHKSSLTNLILITYHVFFPTTMILNWKSRGKSVSLSLFFFLGYFYILAIVNIAAYDPAISLLRKFLKFNNMWKLNSTQTTNMSNKKKDLNKNIKRYHT